MTKRFIAMALLLASQLIASEKPAESKPSTHMQEAIDLIERYPWKGNERVLDIGCRDGKLTALLASKLPSSIIVGVDSSDLKLPMLPNLLFMRARLDTLAFKEQFDLVVSFHALHRSSDPKAVLATIQKSLVSGGHALLLLPAISPNNRLSQCEKLIKSKKWSSDFPSYTPRVCYTIDGYRELLVGAGLTPVSLEEKSSERLYPSKKDFREKLEKRTKRTIHHLSEEKQREFLDDLVEAMLRLNPQAPDGSVRLQRRSLEILAVKQ